MKHTPGPWVIDYTMFRMGYDIKIKDATCHSLIAEISIQNDKDTELFNANLIAAAPELLKAAEDALAFLEYIAKNGSINDENNDLLRNAIAKARGEQ